MDDQSLIEQDIDSVDRSWLDDYSWLNGFSTAPKRNERESEDFLGWVYLDPILISILIFIVGSITFIIIGSIMF